MAKKLFLTALLFLFSCSKGEIYGSFYDFETNKPIENLQVKLLAILGTFDPETSTYVEPYSFKEIITYTDKNGFYHFEYLKKDKYTVFIEGENYHLTLVNDCDLNINLECHVSSRPTSVDYRPKEEIFMPGIPSSTEFKKNLEQKLKDANIDIPNNLSLGELIDYANKHLKISSDTSIKANNADHAD